MVWFYKLLLVSIIGLAALAAFTVAINIDIVDDDMTEFNQLIETLNLKFTSASDLINRLNSFHKAKQEIDGMAAKYPGATFKINRFALMSENERRSFMNATMSDDDENIDEEFHFREKRSALDNTITTPIPSSSDFRDYGKVTSVKDQGQCGACWAFSAIAAIESQYLLRRNQTLDLSEQQAVNCYNYTIAGGDGCEGGKPKSLFISTKYNGLATETCFPYFGRAEPRQQCSDCSSPRYRITGAFEYGRNETGLAYYLYNHGPASMSFYVPPAFIYYAGGVLDVPNEECTMQNNQGAHAMALVGYTADYWIAKNSWGTTWGENGFIRFKRGHNWCEMMHDVYAPFLDPVPTTPNPNVPTTTTPKPSNGTTGSPATTPSITTTTSAPNMCPNVVIEGSQVNDAFRNYALQVFNQYRSKIAKGTHKYDDGVTAPTAKNMGKLTYDCHIEYQVQLHAKNCQWPLEKTMDFIFVADSYPETLAPNAAIDKLAKYLYVSGGSLEIQAKNNTRYANAFSENSSSMIQLQLDVGTETLIQVATKPEKIHTFIVEFLHIVDIMICQFGVMNLAPMQCQCSMH